jgi:hypothetical protein
MKAKTAFWSALIGVILLALTSCVGPFVPPYPNLYTNGYGNMAYGAPQQIAVMQVRLAPLPGATETPYGIVLKEGVLIPLRDLTYDPYQPHQNLPERWFKWCLEYQKTGKYPGWHPCPGGLG